MKKFLFVLMMFYCLVTFKSNPVNAMFSCSYLTPGCSAVWLNNTPEGYEIEVAAYGELGEPIGHFHFAKSGENNFYATLFNITSDPGMSQPGKFTSYRFKLGVLRPGTYNFYIISKQTPDIDEDAVMRKFSFTIPEDAKQKGLDDNIRIDMEMIKDPLNNDTNKPMNNETVKTVNISVALNDAANARKNVGKLTLVVYDSENRELKTITDFTTKEKVIRCAFGIKTDIGRAELIETEYKQLKMYTAELKLERNKSYLLKSIWRLDGKEYVKEINYYNQDIRSLPEDISADIVYTKDNTLAIHYNKEDPCDEYELYEYKQCYGQYPTLVSNLGDFVVGLDHEKTRFFILGKKNGEYISKSNVFGVKNIKVKIIVNDKYINGDSDPIIINNRVWIPLRLVVEALGGDIIWNGREKRISVNMNYYNRLMSKNCNTTFDFTIGDKCVNVNEEVKTLETAPYIFNNRTYLPLRFLIENIKSDINWNNDNKTVKIDMSKPIHPTN